MRHFSLDRRVRRATALAGLLAVSVAPLEAAERYRFKGSHHDERNQGEFSGTVVSDGAAYRQEHDPGETALLHRPGNRDVVLVPAKKTYHYGEAAEGRWPLLRLFVGVRHETSAQEKNHRCDVAPDAARFAGREVAVLHLGIAYEVKIAFPGETVRGTVSVTATYKSVPDLQTVVPYVVDPAIRTGFSAIDERIAGCLAELRGLVILRELTIVRSVVDGATDEYRSRSELTDFQDLGTIDPKTFEIPPGYRYEEPERVIPPSLGR